MLIIIIIAEQSHLHQQIKQIKQIKQINIIITNITKKSYLLRHKTQREDFVKSKSIPNLNDTDSPINSEVLAQSSTTIEI